MRPIAHSSAAITKAFYGNLEASLVKPLDWNEWFNKEVGASYWNVLPTDGLPLTLGYLNGDSRYPVNVNVGPQGPHMTIIGTSGSGKSIFINEVVHTVCHRISPKYLELYMVDMKNAEFPKYFQSVAKLPHAKVIAGTTDVAYTLSVIEHFVNEMKRTNEIISNAEAKDVPSYYEKTGILLPTRWLLVDEFGSLRVYATASEIRKLDELLEIGARLGRSTQHFITFATQDMPVDMPAGILSNFPLKICLKVTAESIADKAIGNSAPLFLPPKGFGYFNNTTYKEDTNVKFRIPLITSRNFDDSLAVLHSRAQAEGFPEPEYYNEKITPPWEDGWQQRAKDTPEKFILGHKGSYIPGSWCTDFTWSESLGSNVVIVSPKKEVREKLLQGFINNFEAKQSSCMLLASNFDDIERYKSLNLLATDLTSNFTQSDVVAQCKSVLLSRKFLREVVNVFLLKGIKSPTMLDFANVCEQRRNHTLNPKPFIETRDGAVVLTEEFEDIKHFYDRIEQDIASKGNFQDIYVIVDGFDAMQGIGQNLPYTGMEWMIDAPKYGIKFLFYGETLADVKTILKTTVNYVVFSNIPESVASTIGVEKAEKMFETIACVYDRRTDTKHMYKLIS